MKIPSKPENEAERITALKEYKILDTLPDQELDNITKIASGVCNMPISLITLLDNERQWFKSKVGLDTTQTPRDYAFCAHAILQPEDVMVITDSSKDERFHDNPLVSGAPYVQFYAGVPLVNPDGLALGTLCVIDRKPNQITKEQKETLIALARQVMLYFELHKKNYELELRQAELDGLNKELEQFAYVLAHDIKSPCSNIVSLSYLISDMLGNCEDKELMNLLSLLSDTSRQMAGMVDGILEHARSVNITEKGVETFQFGELINNLKNLLANAGTCKINVLNPQLEITASYPLVTRILLNLCNNAIKYNDKPNKEITLSAIIQNSTYLISVQDNGIGIDHTQFARIFDLFKTVANPSLNVQGYGIGLYTVKRLVERMGGNINVNSEPGTGSTFSFTLPR